MTDILLRMATDINPAICFDYQVLDDIPAEEFDIRPDMIITDKRIITAQEL